MEENPICASCHVAVRPTDYFCYNCGKNLKSKPPSTSPASLFFLFLMSVFVPVVGVVMAIKYLRAPDQKFKIIGGAALLVTIVSVLFTIQYTISLMGTIEQQINAQLGGLGGF